MLTGVKDYHVLLVQLRRPHDVGTAPAQSPKLPASWDGDIRADPAPLRLPQLPKADCDSKSTAVSRGAAKGKAGRTLLEIL